MTASVNDSSTWRDATRLYVNDVGTWREIISQYVNDGGTWRSVHDTAHLQDVFAENAVLAPTNASASIRVANDGTVLKEEGSGAGFVSQFSWDLASSGAAASNYEIRLASAVGIVTGDATDTWLSLGTTRTWTKTRSSLGSSDGTGTVEIRDASTLDVLASASFRIRVAKVSP